MYYSTERADDANFPAEGAAKFARCMAAEREKTGTQGHGQRHILSIMCRHSSFGDGILFPFTVVKHIRLYYNEYCIPRTGRTMLEI